MRKTTLLKKKNRHFETRSQTRLGEDRRRLTVSRKTFVFCFFILFLFFSERPFPWSPPQYTCCILSFALPSSSDSRPRPVSSKRASSSVSVLSYLCLKALRIQSPSSHFSSSRLDGGFLSANGSNWWMYWRVLPSMENFCLFFMTFRSTTFSKTRAVWTDKTTRSPCRGGSKRQTRRTSQIDNIRAYLCKRADRSYSSHAPTPARNVCPNKHTRVDTCTYKYIHIYACTARQARAYMCI